MREFLKRVAGKFNVYGLWEEFENGKKGNLIPPLFMRWFYFCTAYLNSNGIKRERGRTSLCVWCVQSTRKKRGGKLMCWNILVVVTAYGLKNEQRFNGSNLIGLDCTSCEKRIFLQSEVVFWENIRLYSLLLKERKKKMNGLNLIELKKLRPKQIWA